MGCGRIGRGKDRLYGADAERVGEEDRGRRRQAGWNPCGGCREAEGAGAREPRTAAGERDPAQGLSIFCPGGAGRGREAMLAFIDDHGWASGVEPICKVLPIAPSTYHAHVAKRVDPGKLSARTKQDAAVLTQNLHRGERGW